MTHERESLEANRRKLQALLKDLTTGEGLRPTILDSVRLARADRDYPRTPVLYESSIFIIASGRKKGYVGDRQIVYDQNNYLVLSVPLPFECETHVGDGEPLLGLSVRMDMSLIGELAVKMDLRRRVDAETGCCLNATPLELPMSDAAVRLLECLRSPLDAAVLGPGIVREIAYHALRGPEGNALMAMLGRGGPAAQIHAVLHRIHTRYAEPLNVERLADEIGMSVSSLHHNFKSITASSPLQYLKSVRLHKARLLMTHEGMGAAIAADRVGYESPSQFSREFKRFFGSRPAEDSRRVREQLGFTPAAASVHAEFA